MSSTEGDCGSGGECGCQICGNQSDNKLHKAREMFLGTRDTFTYLQCGSCDTLQITEVPDLRPYYPKAYYAFLPDRDPEEAKPAGLKKRFARPIGASMRRKAAAYYCDRRERFGEYRHPIGRYIAKNTKRVVRGFPDYLKDTSLCLHLNIKSSILDVGSGTGATLFSLGYFGFRNLTGIDPYLESNITYRSGVRLLKAELSTLQGEFDLILANHSLEHVLDPRRALEDLYRLLKRGRYAIIRMPVVASAWRTYQTNWVQLDPPRHLFIFTVNGFTGLCEGAGFAVADVTYDSTSFQFWGSEQYARDIPLVDERSYFVHPEKSIFSAKQLETFGKQAEELNARGEGDQAIFYLRKD